MNPIAFAAIPPGLAGATQINFVVPDTAPLGVQPVVVSVAGVPSPPASVTIISAEDIRKYGGMSADDRKRIAELYP